MSTRLPTATSPALLALALALVAACGSGEGASAGLGADITCTPEDLGAEYHLLTEGEVSVQNLAGLSDDARARQQQLQEAGLRGGRFSYWEEQVGRPPFAPPMQVLCQALEFESAEAAGRFLRELTDDPDELATTAMKWLPRERRAAEEITADAGKSLPAGARSFRITASGAGVDVEIYAVITPNGAYTQGVYVSGAGGLEEALAVMERFRSRTQMLAAPREEPGPLLR